MLPFRVYVGTSLGPMLAAIVAFEESLTGKLSLFIVTLDVHSSSSFL
jgi:hypothetical protein